MADITDLPPELIDMIGEYLVCGDLKNVRIAAAPLAIVFQTLLGSYITLPIAMTEAGGALLQSLTAPTSARLPPMAQHIRRIYFINYDIMTHIILLDKDYEIAEKKTKKERKKEEKRKVQEWKDFIKKSSENSARNVDDDTKSDIEQDIDEENADEDVAEVVDEEANQDIEENLDEDSSEDAYGSACESAHEDVGEHFDDDDDGDVEKETRMRRRVDDDERLDKPTIISSNDSSDDNSDSDSDDEDDDKQLYRMHKYSKVAVMALSAGQTESILTPSEELLQRMARALRSYTQLKSVNTVHEPKSMDLVFDESLPGALLVEDHFALRDLDWSTVKNWKQWGKDVPDAVDFWTGKKCIVIHRDTISERYPQEFKCTKKITRPPALELPKLSKMLGGRAGGSFSVLLQHLTISTFLFKRQNEWDGDVSLIAKMLAFIPHCQNLRRLRVTMGWFAEHSEMAGLIEALGPGHLPHLTHLRIDGGQYAADHYEKLLEHRWKTLEFLFLAPELCVNTGTNFASFIKLCRQSPVLKEFLVDFFIWGIEVSRNGSGMKYVDERMADRAAMKDKRPDGPGFFGPDLLQTVYNGAEYMFGAVLKGLWPVGDQAEELATEFVEYFNTVEFD